MKRIIKGVERTLWVEEVIEGRGDTVFISNLREPTEEEVKEFFSKPCNHKKKGDQLIYDVHSFMYDFRYCAVCGCSLGLV